MLRRAERFRAQHGDAPMTTPQAPAKRHKQKRRRAKKLAEWRDKQEKKPAAPAKEKKK